MTDSQLPTKQAAGDRHKIPDVIDVSNDKDKDKDKGTDATGEQRTPSRWSLFTSRLYDSTVKFAAELIGDVLSHPRVHDTVVALIVEAVNQFMDQEDIGTKVDSTARRVIYDREKARDASRALGKEVVPMMTGFVGGVASSLTPAVLKKRHRQAAANARHASSLTTVDSNLEPQHDTEKRK
eukprot:jgi/Psemu1/312672/fgenesh1_kg.999_\